MPDYKPSDLYENNYTANRINGWTDPNIYIGTMDRPVDYFFTKRFNLIDKKVVYTDAIIDNNQIIFALGNNEKDETKATGALRLYGRKAYHADLTASNNMTDHRTLILPDADGVLALADHTHEYLPLDGGVIHGPVTFDYSREYLPLDRIGANCLVLGNDKIGAFLGFGILGKKGTRHIGLSPEGKNFVITDHDKDNKLIYHEILHEGNCKDYCASKDHEHDKYEEELEYLRAKVSDNYILESFKSVRLKNKVTLNPKGSLSYSEDYEIDPYMDFSEKLITLSYEINCHNFTGKVYVSIPYYYSDGSFDTIAICEEYDNSNIRGRHIAFEHQFPEGKKIKLTGKVSVTISVSPKEFMDAMKSDNDSYCYIDKLKLEIGKRKQTFWTLSQYDMIKLFTNAQANE